MKYLKTITAALLLTSITAHAVTLTFNAQKPLTIKVDGQKVELTKTGDNQFTGSIENLEGSSDGKTYILKALDANGNVVARASISLKNQDKSFDVNVYGRRGSFTEAK